MSKFFTSILLIISLNLNCCLAAGPTPKNKKHYNLPSCFNPPSPEYKNTHSVTQKRTWDPNNFPSGAFRATKNYLSLTSKSFPCIPTYTPSNNNKKNSSTYSYTNINQTNR